MILKGVCPTFLCFAIFLLKAQFGNAATTTPGMMMMMTTTTPAFMPTTQTELCDDIDSGACQLMHKSRPDLCSDPSIADTACRRYCGQCPVQCYTCPTLVKDMSQCNMTTMCEASQDCYTMEVFDFDQSHGFRGGCIDKSLCVPQGGGDQIFGRSSSTVHMTCCDTDKCNSQVLTTTTTRPTTTHSCHDMATNCHAILACLIEEHRCRKTCGLC